MTLLWNINLAVAKLFQDGFLLETENSALKNTAAGKGSEFYVTFLKLKKYLQFFSSGLTSNRKNQPTIILFDLEMY